MTLWKGIAAILAAYLLGSVPTALLYSKLTQGMDIRELGDMHHDPARNVLQHGRTQFQTAIRVACRCVHFAGRYYQRRIGRAIGSRGGPAGSMELPMRCFCRPGARFPDFRKVQRRPGVRHDYRSFLIPLPWAHPDRFRNLRHRIFHYAYCRRGVESGNGIHRGRNLVQGWLAGYHWLYRFTTVVHPHQEMARSWTNDGHPGT